MKNKSQIFQWEQFKPFCRGFKIRQQYLLQITGNTVTGLLAGCPKDRIFANMLIIQDLDPFPT